MPDDEHHDQRYEDGEVVAHTIADYDDEWSPRASERELREAHDFYAGKRFDRLHDGSQWLEVNA